MARRKGGSFIKFLDGTVVENTPENLAKANAEAEAAKKKAEAKAKPKSTKEK